MNDDSEYLLTKLGISFTQDTINSMRWFLGGLPQPKNCVILWGLQQNPEGHIKAIFGADPADKHPRLYEIKDEIDGLTFYWCVKQASLLDFLRENFCLHSRWEEKVEFIPLHKSGSE
jgi:hypothetical protein